MAKPSDIHVNNKAPFKRNEEGVDRFLIRAKELVVKNYNDHRPEEKEEIDLGDVYITWFSKQIGNWKALLSTNSPDGLYYEVTHNGARKETYCDVYKKIGKATYPDNAIEPRTYEKKEATND